MTTLESDTERRIASLVATLRDFGPGRPLDKFITYTTFPRYKNFESGTRINFEFPITILVGPNGTGKTSLLHALWGMPEGNTLGRFWFSTSVDAIAEGGEEGPHRFVYGHWLATVNKVVASRKARVTKTERGFDYWEPTKAVVSDGMDKMPSLVAAPISLGRTKDRWNAVDRKALFLNFKGELSAYDKYMYLGRDPKLTNLKSRQDVIRRDSRHIKHVIDSHSQNHMYYGRAVTAENRILNPDELAAVGQILGRDYEEARIIRHRLFGGSETNDGLTVVFRRKHATYSEAHAGSGEVAVVSAVIQVLAAEKYTLLLLDEPEVSLHPHAQRRFMAFLMEQIKLKFHQVVVSSHSAEIFRGLPKQAIKLLEERPSGKFTVRENVSPSMAFASLGAPVADRLSIYVEDELAAIVVNAAIVKLNPAEKALIDVRSVPTGAAGICANLIPTWVLMGQVNILVLLDGDQRPLTALPFISSAEIPVSKDADLGQIIFGLVKCDPNFPVSGNAGVANAAQKVSQQRAYVDWYLKHVRYLPLSSPEHIILAALTRMDLATPNETLTSNEAKQTLLMKVGRSRSDFESADEIHHVYKHKLIEARSHATELEQIVEAIVPFVSALNAG